jgi:hypothetical protein
LLSGGGSSQPSCERYKEFSATWGWYNTIESLSNGDLSKQDYVLNRPVIVIFNHLSFCSDKANAEEANRKYLEQIEKGKR